MKNYDVLKQMPIPSFANIVFNVVKRECQTEEDFVAFLEKEYRRSWREPRKRRYKNCSTSVLINHYSFRACSKRNHYNCNHPA